MGLNHTGIMKLNLGVIVTKNQRISYINNANSNLIILRVPIIRL